ncbi:MAG: glycine cleavage system protein GcvH [Spirochaetaceae bacterium]|nr:MAG: glycine cleavage system protein GcvH [Spirochaetaceae bacterium]
MEIPKDLKYAKTHEWVRVEGEVAYVGISDYAQEELGDIVYVEMPAAGDSYDKGEEAATVESVKAASAIYTPVAGTVEKINPELEGTPELINQQPYQAFIFAIRFSDASGLDQLLDAESYQKHVEQEKASH